MHARADERGHALLRLRRDLLDPAARAVGRTAQAQDRGADRKRPRGDRNGEHRLPRAPARGRARFRSGTGSRSSRIQSGACATDQAVGAGIPGDSSVHQLTHVMPGAVVKPRTRRRSDSLASRGCGKSRWRAAAVQPARCPRRVGGTVHRRLPAPRPDWPERPPTRGDPLAGCACRVGRGARFHLGRAASRRQGSTQRRPNCNTMINPGHSRSGSSPSAQAPRRSSASLSSLVPCSRAAGIRSTTPESGGRCWPCGWSTQSALRDYCCVKAGPDC